jgi:hypothetical protein
MAGSRVIDNGGGLAVGDEQRLYALSQVPIRCTFPIENGRLLERIRDLNRRQENSVNTACINGHNMVLEKGVFLQLWV